MPDKKKKKPSPAKIKAKLKKQCDILWSSITKQIHRAKYGKICLWCKKKSNRLQSDHVFNRWKHSTRWNTANCVCLDVGCHLFRKKREPLAWAEMVQENIPEDTYADLKRGSELMVKVDIEFLRDTLDYLQTMDTNKPWETRT
jgi:hypothetical protein